MATTVKLLPHQANLVQAPYVFPDIRSGRNWLSSTRDIFEKYGIQK